MKTELFDFELPEELIALEPAEPRDSARLLVVRPGEPRPFEDRIVSALPDLLRPGDVLVLNDTRVIPAALEGVRIRGERRARVSFNLIERIDDSRWQALARPAKRLEPGDVVRFGAEGRVCLAGDLVATIAAKGEAGEVELSFNLSGSFLDSALEDIGETPLPPYIALKRPATAADKARYQTIYAANDGAVAAPTAGLHFTQDLFVRLAARGISREFLTLHVGAGTFLPVKAANTADHRMHAEWGEIGANAARRLNETRTRGGRIVAVGTTSLRLLETAASPDGVVQPFRGGTDIFITPGYRFRAADLLVTNFHLPRSTLFMLVAAFSGLDTMRAAYDHAVRERYRFYSYGDACLLHRAE